MEEHSQSLGRDVSQFELCFQAPLAELWERSHGHGEPDKNPLSHLIWEEPQLMCPFAQVSP